MLRVNMQHAWQTAALGTCLPAVFRWCVLVLTCHADLQAAVASDSVPVARQLLVSCKRFSSLLSCWRLTCSPAVSQSAPCSSTVAP